MSSTPRALAFARRFAPFWMIWLLIFLLPASRQPLQFQLFGSPFTPNSNPPWAVDERFDSRFDSFALVERSPGDLNARIWRFSQMSQGKNAGFDKMGEQNRRNYRPEELIAEAEAIQTEFKGEKWLGALSMRVFRAQLSGNKSALPPQQALEALESAARLEPDNAFYPLIEAEFWRRQHDFPAMWRALNRAATRKTLDTHDLKWARAIVKAHDAARPLILEEREALWRDNLDSNWVSPPDWPTFLAHEARKSQKSGDHRRAIKIGVLLGSIGDLMQRTPNTRAMAVSGHDWKANANSLIWRSYPPNIKLTPATWARNFSSYAAAHGRPDVSLLTRKWKARQKQLYALSIYSPNSGPTAPVSKPPKDALYRAGLHRNASAFVGVHLLFVAAFWLLVNLVLWRGIGAPSSAKDRIIPALSMALLGLSMALWSWQQIEILDAARWTPGKEKYFFAVGSVAVVAFFGAPFLLAVWAAGMTLWRHKTEFFKPARIETELRLSPRDVTILKSGPAIFCIAALLFTLGFWLSYLLLVAFDIPNFDLLAWLPDDGRVTQWSLPIPTEMLAAPIIYCLFLDFLGFLVWFNKWRYYAGKESRPLTHGGLRAWKESLGVYLVFGSAIYLGVALLAWPVRTQATRELEHRMVRGELPP